MEIYAALIGLFGVMLGFGLDRLYRHFEYKREYLANSKIVLLMLTKQLNEFGDIKKHFNQYKNEEDVRFVKLPAYLVSPSEWRLSKQDLIKLVGDGNNEIVKIMLDIMLLDKNFKDLLLAIDDHHRFREPIIQREQNANQITLNEFEQIELKRYLEAIDRRISKLDFSQTYDKLHTFLKHKFPKEKFMNGEIKDQAQPNS